MNNSRFIVITFLKAFAVIVLTLIVVFLLIKVAPPPKNSAFDGLKYVLLPLYASTFLGGTYFIVSLIKRSWEKWSFYAALSVSIIYAAVIFLTA